MSEKQVEEDTVCDTSRGGKKALGQNNLFQRVAGGGKNTYRVFGSVFLK